MRAPRVTYWLHCRICQPGDEPILIPFEDQATRGHWAARHREATGHDSWWAPERSDGEQRCETSKAGQLGCPDPSEGSTR